METKTLCTICSSIEVLLTADGEPNKFLRFADGYFFCSDCYAAEVREALLEMDEGEVLECWKEYLAALDIERVSPIEFLGSLSMLSDYHFGHDIFAQEINRRLQHFADGIDYTREIIERLRMLGFEATIGTNFDVRISREAAEFLLSDSLFASSAVAIMCEEYGEDEDWSGLESEDLDSAGRLDSDYQTLELWFPSDTVSLNHFSSTLFGVYLKRMTLASLDLKGLSLDLRAEQIVCPLGYHFSLPSQGHTRAEPLHSIRFEKSRAESGDEQSFWSALNTQTRDLESRLCQCSEECIVCFG